MINLDSEKWYQGLAPNLRPLALLSWQLLAREKASQKELQNSAVSMSVPIQDYQFIVFPLAKAFEAFLKDLLYNAGLITDRTYNSKKFSIGRSLNPDVRLEQRDQYWYFDDLAHFCGEQTARFIWDTWLERNRLFHLYPGEEYHLSLEEAEAKMRQIIRAIDLCLFCAREQQPNTPS